MNVVSDQDLELLEQYLDGALSPEETLRVEARLSDESELADALNELDDERTARAKVWSSLEPTQAQADKFAAKVRTAARRENLWGRVGHAARFGTAAAACLLLGVFIGWMGQDRGTGYTFRSSGGTAAMQVSNELTVSHPNPQGLGVLISQINLITRGQRPMPVLMVHQVQQGSPAAEAGLQPGDVLLTLDGELLRDGDNLEAVTSRKQGQRVVLRVLRDRHLHDVAVRLR